MPSSCGDVAASTLVAAPCSGVLNLYAPELRAGPQSLRVDVPREVGLQDRAGVDGVGGDAVTGPMARRSDGEEHVRGLGLPVGEPRVVRAGGEVQVVEDDRRPEVPAGAERHDPGVAGGRERVVQPERKREVAEVIRGELHLDAARGELELGQRHHAGVVDEQVQRPVPAAGERGDRRQIGEVEPADMDVRVAGRRGDVGRGPVARAGVAHGERDVRSRAGERARRLDPDARRAARDDRALAAEVDALDHLRGGRVEAERRGDAVVGDHGELLTSGVCSSGGSLRFQRSYHRSGMTFRFR